MKMKTLLYMNLVLWLGVLCSPALVLAEIPAAHEFVVVYGADGVATNPATQEIQTDGSQVTQLHGEVSDANSSVIPLLAGTSFVGEWVEALDVGSVNVDINTDQLGSCYFENSHDGITVDRSFLHLLDDAVGYRLFFSITPRAKFIRIRFTNTSLSDQTSFRMQTILSTNERGAVYIPIEENLTGNSTALTTKAILSGRRDDGLFGNVKLSDTNALVTVAESIGWAISRGTLTGYYSGTAKGERKSIAVVTTGVDIWGGVTSEVPIPPDTGSLVSVVSTSVEDTNVTGTGVWIVDLYYIDPADGLEKEIQVELNGTTPVETGLLMRYVNNLYSIAADGTKSAVGTIRAFKTGTPLEVYREISIGSNTGQGCNFMVPGNMNVYLTEWKCSVAGTGKPVAMRLRTTIDERSGTITPRLFHTLDTDYIESGAGGGKFGFPVKVPPYSIIKVSAYASQAGPFVSAGFAGWMAIIQ